MIFFVVFLVVLGSAGIAGIKAAPWVPTRNKDLKRLTELGEITERDVVYDLGAGDGRLVFYISKNTHAEVAGFELSILPYLISRIKRLFFPRVYRANILYKDFYKVDLSPASVIVCFLTPKAMAKLKPKFEKELKDGARIISYAFRIKDWPIAKMSKTAPNETPIFKYVINKT